MSIGKQDPKGPGWKCIRIIDHSVSLTHNFLYLDSPEWADVAPDGRFPEIKKVPSPKSKNAAIAPIPMTPGYIRKD